VTTVAIGDIHGNCHALEDVLEQLTGELSDDDTVIFLGDYIDRGPDSKACIDRILAFRAESRAKVVTLLGNHEDWLLRTIRDATRHSWLLGMEAFETIASYSPVAAGALRRAAEEAGMELVTRRVELPYRLFFDLVPPAHIDFFEALVPYYRTPDAICVHGGFDPRAGALEEQTVGALVWGPDDFPEGYEGSETVVYGHRNNAAVDADGWPRPRVRNRTIGIDTISHGILTALRLPEGRVVQSRRRYSQAIGDAGRTPPLQGRPHI
jgi:serine/threonine protein phosphatase 1